MGQVLDVETGENETLGVDFTEEALLKRFPKLSKAENKVVDTVDTFAEKTFDGHVAAELVLRAILLEEERVAVYKDFDLAFKFLLEAQQATRALAWLYPFVVRMATERFQAKTNLKTSLTQCLCCVLFAARPSRKACGRWPRSSRPGLWQPLASF